MSQNNIAMVPVHQEDFKKFNEFAEAAWICRDLENADRIKEIRKTLLKEVTIILKRCKNSSNIAAQPGFTESHRREKEENLRTSHHLLFIMLNVFAISK